MQHLDESFTLPDTYDHFMPTNIVRKQPMIQIIDNYIKDQQNDNLIEIDLNDQIPFDLYVSRADLEVILRNLEDKSTIYLIQTLKDLLIKLEKLTSHLRTRFSKYHRLSYKLKEHHEYINNFIIELKIVEILLGNGDLNQIQELKKSIQISSQPPQELPKQEEYNLKAQTRQDVNCAMLNQQKNFFFRELLPREFQVAQKYYSGNPVKQHQNCLNELKMINSWMGMFVRTYFTAVDRDQNDIILHDQHDTEWQKLEPFITYKKLGDRKRVNYSFQNFTKAIRIAFALVYKRNNFRSPILKKMAFPAYGIWYFLLDERAKKRCIQHLSELTIHSATEVLSFMETPGLKQIIQAGLPAIATNVKLYIDSIIFPITMDLIKEEMKNGTLGKITPKPLSLINMGIHNDANYRKELFIKNKQKIKIRLLCHEKLEEPLEDVEEDDDDQGWFRKIYDHLTLTKQQKYFDKIIIHIHGGGFIAGSSSQHQYYLREWAIKLKIPVFSIDYGLAPQSPYPDGLDDCWQSYNWILQRIYRYFNIIPSKIVLAGDSAGANLCISLAALAIKYGTQQFDGLYIAYPVLDIKLKYSPSHEKSLNDLILSHTAMDLCIQSVLKHPDADPVNDFFLSPQNLPNEILQKFPPTRMVVGENDPIKDHSIRFLQSLVNNKVNVKLIQYEEISHGFLNFYTLKGMKEVDLCVKDSLNFMQELFYEKQK